MATPAPPDQTEHEESVGESAKSVLEWMKDNQLALTLGLFAFLIFKVLVVARGSVDTALAIVNANGIVPVVVGEILSSLPVLAVIALGVTTYKTGGHLHRARQPKSDPPHEPTDAERDERNRYRMSIAAGAAVILIAICYAPVGLFATVAPLAGYAGWRHEKLGRWRLDLKRRFGRWLLAIIGGAVVVGIAGYGFIWGVAYVMWIPHERVMITGHGIEVGYVVSDNSGWMTMLQSGTRRPLRFADKDVVKRDVCHVRGSWDRFAQYSVVQFAFIASGHRFGTLPDCRPKPSPRK